MRTRLPHAVLIGAVLLPGCADRRAAPTATTRDSAGITIVESAEPAWSEGEGWSVLPEPELDIGVLEGEEPYLLSQVRGARRLSDGRIVVANSGTHQLRYYDSTGKHLISVGREGSGPGEFQRLSTIHVLSEDTVMAFDSGSRRISFFDADGVFVRSANLETGESIRFPWIFGILEDGTLLGRAGGVFIAGQSPSGVDRRPVSILAYGGDGTLGDTIVTLAGDEAFVRSSGTSMSVSMLAFGKQTVMADHGNQLWAGETERFEVRAYDVRGAPSRIVRVAAEPLPVTREDFEIYRDRNLESTPEAFRENQAEMYERMPVPETMPFFTRILLDPAGHLWMKRRLRPADERSLWAVFSPEGSLLGDVEVPRGLLVHEIGDGFLLGRWSDDFDVEHVRVHFLDRSGAPAS